MGDLLHLRSHAECRADTTAQDYQQGRTGGTSPGEELWLGLAGLSLVLVRRTLGPGRLIRSVDEVRLGETLVSLSNPSDVGTGKATHVLRDDDTVLLDTRLQASAIGEWLARPPAA